MLSKPPLSSLALSQTQAVTRASFIISLPVQADQGISRSVLNHADYNEQFQAVLSRYRDMISYHVMVWLYISLLLMVCFDLNPKYICFVSTAQYKESPHEAGFIFEDVSLIFLCRTHRMAAFTGWYCVIFILLSNPSGDKTPIVTQPRETVYVLSHGTFTGRIYAFLEDIF